ncbi:hypothetical protein [Vreelandella venusta]|uniref:hypothetical protein n=1 Tax=Vreelandella venusta TaxID=44935 RepID=UPI003C2DDA5B
MSIKHAVESAYWLLKHRDSIPPLSTLRLYKKPQKSRYDEQRILSALWDIDKAIRYPGLCHHPIIDLMTQSSEESASHSSPQHLVENEVEAERNSRLLQTHLASINRQMRENEENKKRIDNFERMARKHHQCLVQNINKYLITPSLVQVVQLETGYFHQQVGKAHKSESVNPPLQSLDRLITLQRDRDQLLKQLRASRTSVGGLVGYVWQLFWSPVLGFYLRWWWFFHDTNMTLQERSHLLGDLWRHHIASKNAMTIHEVPKPCHSRRPVPEDTGVFSLQKTKRLEVLQQQVEAQASMSYYQQINADFFINLKEVYPQAGKPLAVMKRVRTAGNGGL